jgi:hypothetical protein
MPRTRRRRREMPRGESVSILTVIASLLPRSYAQSFSIRLSTGSPGWQTHKGDIFRDRERGGNMIAGAVGDESGMDSCCQLAAYSGEMRQHGLGVRGRHYQARCDATFRQSRRTGRPQTQRWSRALRSKLGPTRVGVPSWPIRTSSWNQIDRRTLARSDAPRSYRSLVALRSSETVGSSRMIDTVVPIDAAPSKASIELEFTDFPNDSLFRAVGIRSHT